MKNRFPVFIRWLLVVTFITRIALAFRPEVKLTERPYQDDAYYALTCGYHLAEGHGFSIDGIHPTNGVQPLIIPVYAFIFTLSGLDKWLGVRLTFIFVALVECFCVYALYRLTLSLKRSKISDENKLLRSEYIAPFLWTFLFGNMLLNTCGLETGLYAALIISSIWYYNNLKQIENAGISLPHYRWVLFGIILGLMVLARIDGAIIVISFALIESLMSHKPLIKKLSAPAIFCTTALLISSPWWVYNYSTFGSIMPISGQSEAIGSLLPMNIETGISVLRDLLLALFYIPYHLSEIMSIFLLLSIIAVYFFIDRQFGIIKELRNRYFLAPLLPLIIGGIIQSIYYIGFFSAPHFLGRYLHPLRIAWLILFSLSIPLLLQSVSKSKTQASAMYMPMVILGSLFLIGAICFNTGSYILDFTTAKSSQAYHIGVWAKKLPNEKIGLGSSGTVGFMDDNIINLDGKVNFDALQARKDGRLGEYIVKSGITILTDWDYISNVNQIKSYGVEFIPIDMVSGAGIYKRVSLKK